jgi:S-formylglutathione hydrolase
LIKMGLIKISQIETKLVPGPVTYSALYPDNYEEGTQKYPLILFLHGGGGNHTVLNAIKPIVEELWKTKKLFDAIVVSPSCTRSLYMDYQNGTEKWESFLMKEFIPYLISKLPLDKEKIILSGISMGGLGSLRLGFKYPNSFQAIVAFEPAIEPALEWKDVEREDKYYRSSDFLEKIFGTPFDVNYWKINNPMNILKENSANIKKSGIKIYIDVGTEDLFGLYRGAEFLHQLLFNQNIKHEYRVVYGADHVGPSLEERFTVGFGFINRIYNPYILDKISIGYREMMIKEKEKYLKEGE